MTRLPTTDGEAFEILDKERSECEPYGGWLTNALAAVSHVEATKTAKREASARLRRVAKQMLAGLRT